MANYKIVFSPTGGVKKCTDLLSSHLGSSWMEIDLSHPISPISLQEEDLCIYAVPSFGGRVVPIVTERLKNIHGNGAKAIRLCVYGNRAYEEAAEQLYEFVRSRGFVPVAVGAFVGEHSYSTSQHPIATGRPDATDLADARAWGKAIAEKLSCAKHPKRIDIATLKEPRNSIFSTIRFVLFVLKQRRNKSGVKPHVEVIDHKCKRCGKCAKLCPTGAIEAGNCLHTDTTRCIKCCACVKGCPTKARKLDTPYAPILSQCFKKRKSPVTTL